MPDPRSDFSDYVVAHRDELRRLAYASCGDWHNADDIVQIALSKLYRAWPRIHRHAAEHAYARRIVLHVAIDESRRPWRRESPVDRHPILSEAAVEPGRADLLEVLGALPAQQHKVVLLRYWLGLSIEETARTLGVTTGTVESQSARGLAKLRPQLIDDDRGARTVGEAQRVIVSDCMAAKGFDYRPGPTSVATGLRAEYGDDVARARRIGLGIAKEYAATRALLRQERASRDQPDYAARLRALRGPRDALVTVQVGGSDGWSVSAPARGCEATALIDLYGSVEAAVVVQQLTDNLVTAPLDRAADDPALDDELQAWSACMQDRGHDVAERDAARGLVYLAYDSLPRGAAVATELEIATDDAECDRRAGYTPARRAVEDVYLTDFWQQNTQLVADATASQARALRNARGTSR